DFSAFARVSNHSAISSKPSSRAVRAIPGVLVGFTGDYRAKVILGRPDGLPSRRIPDLLEIFKVAVRMAGLAFGCRTKYCRDVVKTLDIGLLREIQITTVCLALAGERRFQILFGL